MTHHAMVRKYRSLYGDHATDSSIRTRALAVRRDVLREAVVA
jgi:hypothetical protein